MGYKMKGPTFFGKSSPMKITSSGNTSMVNAYTKAVNAEAESEAAMGKNMGKGVDDISKSAQKVVKAAKGAKSNDIDKPKDLPRIAMRGKVSLERTNPTLVPREENKLAVYGRTDGDDKAGPAKQKSCNCWKGYKRVKGTKPCAPGSCKKA
ncbi:hypothetical protein N9Y89_01095 [bacterium]|nr:hypothetical protein [bacterium]